MWWKGGVCEDLKGGNLAVWGLWQVGSVPWGLRGRTQSSTQILVTSCKLLSSWTQVLLWCPSAYSFVLSLYCPEHGWERGLLFMGPSKMPRDMSCKCRDDGSSNHAAFIKSCGFHLMVSKGLWRGSRAGKGPDQRGILRSSSGCSTESRMGNS